MTPIRPIPKWATCQICRTRFRPGRSNQRNCSPECYLAAVSLQTSRRRGSITDDEDVIGTRDRAWALEIVGTARARGCQPAHPRNSQAWRRPGPCVSAWHRGGGLYIIRVRWPDGERIVA